VNNDCWLTIERRVQVWNVLCCRRIQPASATRALSLSTGVLSPRLLRGADLAFALPWLTRPVASPLRGRCLSATRSAAAAACRTRLIGSPWVRIHCGLLKFHARVRAPGQGANWRRGWDDSACGLAPAGSLPVGNGLRGCRRLSNPADWISVGSNSLRLAEVSCPGAGPGARC
jgi:hypothetical protein